MHLRNGEEGQTNSSHLQPVTGEGGSHFEADEAIAESRTLLKLHRPCLVNLSDSNSSKHVQSHRDGYLSQLPLTSDLRTLPPHVADLCHLTTL